MTTEETELTFVRCPSCRSLVPAVATRCRMCGHSFTEENETSSPEQSSEKKRSRVRQRTISVSRDEVDEMSHTSNDIDDGPTPTEHEEASAVSEPLPDFDFGGAANEKEPVVEVRKAPEEESTESRPRKPSGVSAEHTNKIDSPTSDFSISGSPKFSLSEETGADDSDSDSDQQSEGKRKRRRRKRRRSGTSDGEGERSVSQVREQVRDESRQPAVQASRVEPKVEPKIENTSEVVADGMLIGWFVEFASDSNGISREIRAGRFFIGRQRLRGHDMVIEDASLSTPHCLVFADSSGHLQIQDLMSERGTSVKRKGNTSYESISESVSVQHGDRIRFGSLEVLVCLIPERQ